MSTGFHCTSSADIYCIYILFRIKLEILLVQLSQWTRHIQHIFEKHSGSSIGPNQLRSSFVTYLLDGQVSVSDSLAQDVAAAMRHSVRYVSPLFFKLYIVHRLFSECDVYTLHYYDYNVEVLCMLSTVTVYTTD